MKLWLLISLNAALVKLEELEYFEVLKKVISAVDTHLKLPLKKNIFGNLLLPNCHVWCLPRWLCQKQENPSIIMLDEKNLFCRSWKYFFKVWRHLPKIYLVQHIFAQFPFSSCDLSSPSSWHYQKQKNQNIFRPKEKTFLMQLKYVF